MIREGWPVDHPLATVETYQGQRRITAVSRLAAEQGVSPGNNLAQARAVCPTLVVADADPESDRAGLARIAAWCERFSPLTAIDPPDGLWIDITGCAHLAGGEKALADIVAHKLAPCRVAIAGTPAAAWALARAATRKQIEIIQTGTERAALETLPVAMLRLDTRVVAGLRRVGLRSIGEMARQSRSDLTTRFGAQTNLRLDQAFGKAPENIRWLHEKSPWSEHMAFAEPIGTADDLTRSLIVLADKICLRLESKGVGAKGFVATFYRVDDLKPQIEISLSRPLHEASRIARLLVAKLEIVDPGLGIEAIMLEAFETSPLPPRQQMMGGTPQSEELPAILDELGNRLAPDRLWRAIPQASHVPERATTTAPPLDQAPKWATPSGQRPLRLLQPPEPIEASAPVPDDPPILFRWRGALHRVHAATGPERIGAEWWRRDDDDERFRDYYYVEDQTGARFWLFRTDTSQSNIPTRWFLHGLFG